MVGADEAKIRLRKFLGNRFPQIEGRGIGEDEPLLETGVLDSLGVLDLVEFLENEFKIEIIDDELLPENFETIKRITSFVLKKLHENVEIAEH